MPAPAAPEPPKEFETALASITPDRQHRRRRFAPGSAPRAENGKTRVTSSGARATAAVGCAPREAGPRERHRDGAGRLRAFPRPCAGCDGRVGGTAGCGGVGRRSARARTGAGGLRGAAGPMQLRYSVENANAGVIDTDVREIAVPDLTAPSAAEHAAQCRARTVKEFREISANAHAIPSAAREFRRTDRLVIRFVRTHRQRRQRSAPSC